MFVAFSSIPKARFLAKLHRRRFERAQRAYPLGTDRTHLVRGPGDFGSLARLVDGRFFRSRGYPAGVNEEIDMENHRWFPFGNDIL